MPNLDGLRRHAPDSRVGGGVAQVPIIAFDRERDGRGQAGLSSSAGMNDHVASSIELAKLALAITSVLSLEQEI